MFRFLLLCIILFLLYIGFTYVTAYDTGVGFTVMNYQIETTLFTFGVVLLVGLLLLLMGLKFLFFIFDLPELIRARIKKNLLQRLNAKLLKAIAELLMGNRDRGLNLAAKVLEEQGGEDKDIEYLINAEKEEVFDQKVRYLRNLINRKNYSIYAARALAKIFYQNSHYAEAEEYAVKAFNEDDTDTKVMLLLIRIYAKMAIWSKMVFVVSKLQRADSKLLKSISDEVAQYYFLAAKSSLASEDDGEAAKYLESALELKLDYLEALILYTEIKTSMKSTPEVLKLLRTAYSLSPSFQIAELFIKSSSSSAEAIYNTLAGIADPREYNSLYLAIAAYLDLPDRIYELKNPKLLTHNSGRI